MSNNPWWRISLAKAQATVDRTIEEVANVAYNDVRRFFRADVSSSPRIDLKGGNAGGHVGRPFVWAFTIKDWAVSKTDPHLNCSGNRQVMHDLADQILVHNRTRAN